MRALLFVLLIPGCVISDCFECGWHAVSPIYNPAPAADDHVVDTFIAAGVTRSFSLSDVPVGDLEVTVTTNAELLTFFVYDPVTDQGDYTFDPVANQIAFRSYVPPPGSTVEIRYVPARLADQDSG